ncbi:INT_Rci_Hp1_C domain containing protein [uncultured Caudovirales phage]|uniref:Integrase n=1 Tax=uncultured Caudovirales phage TaxID=2100421 RepID=A0A6J5KI91_9CAUD|nr:INT_Rci_Hp1_C domain containing protein [uncultured Caudovirales phage]
MLSRDQIVTMDTKIPGLQLRKLATKSVWYLYYRDRHGKQRKPALGDARIINRHKARELALQILAAVAAGKDVTAMKRNTMADLWAQYETKWLPRKKPRSQDEDRTIWRLHIKPQLGDLLVAEIRPREIAAVHEAMIATPYRANATMRLLSKMMNLAKQWEWREGDNPVRVEKYAEHKRKRVPSVDEIRRVIDALPKSDPYLRGLIELLIYTGARLREIMHCRRDWIHEGAIHLPDSKTGEKVIFLSAPALACIDRIPITRGNPHLICGRIEGQPFHSPKKGWAGVLQRAKVENLRIHDLRRFYASTGLSAGLTLEAVGALLGHASTDTTAGYAYMQTGAAKAAADLTGKAIAAGQIIKP